MEVHVGACGVAIAVLSIFFGMSEVGLWVACYFECQVDTRIEFNFFTAVWTGVPAFATGFMICVLACVKFRMLGSFIVAVTFVLVPCEVFCTCIYAYRAYLSRDVYFDVRMFSAMSVCGIILFIITIMWNCYYCCIATPQEDYEEEVKEDLDEEDKRQKKIREAQERFINNPIVDDPYRNRYPTTQTFSQPGLNRYPEPAHVQFAGTRNDGYPDNYRSRQDRNTRHHDPNRNHDKRRDNRYQKYPQSAPIREEFAYPPAFNRELTQDHRNWRPQEVRVMRPNANQSNSRAQMNRGYEPDDFGRPVQPSYNLHNYLSEGVQRSQPTNQQSRYGGPNQNQRHVNRPGGLGAQPSNFTEPLEEDRAHIYRPRPENFRGKPQKPEYLQQPPQQQQQQHQQQQQQQQPVREEYLGESSAQYSAFRGSGAVDSYF